MKVVILGAGGHAKVVCDALLSSGVPESDVLGFADDNPACIGTTVMGFPVLGSLDALKIPRTVRVVMGVGDNAARRRLFERARALGYDCHTVVHPRAVIGRGSQLGAGVVVMANVVVNTDTRIEDDVILNTACSVDHDCRVGAHSHIAPGARVAGSVTVGEESMVGIGAAVLPGLWLGAGCLVGAGSVVTRAVESGCVVVGAPARVIKQQKARTRD